MGMVNTVLTEAVKVRCAQYNCSSNFWTQDDGSEFTGQRPGHLLSADNVPHRENTLQHYSDFLHTTLWQEYRRVSPRPLTRAVGVFSVQCYQLKIRPVMSMLKMQYFCFSNGSSPRRKPDRISRICSHFP